MVQKVTVNAGKGECSKLTLVPILICGSNTPDDAFDISSVKLCGCLVPALATYTYYEAWRVKKSSIKPLVPNAELNQWKKTRSFHDEASAKLIEFKNSCGEYQQEDEIRFYSDSQMMGKDPVSGNGGIKGLAELT